MSWLDSAPDWRSARAETALRTGEDPAAHYSIAPKTPVRVAYSQKSGNPSLPEWRVYADEAERAGLVHGQKVARCDGVRDRRYRVVVVPENG